MFLSSLDSGLSLCCFFCIVCALLRRWQLCVRLSVHLCLCNVSWSRLARRAAGCGSQHIDVYCGVRSVCVCVCVCVCVTVKGNAVLSNVCLCVLRVSRSCTPLALYVCVRVFERATCCDSSQSVSLLCGSADVNRTKKMKGMVSREKKRKRKGWRRGRVQSGCVWVRALNQAEEQNIPGKTQ